LQAIVSRQQRLTSLGEMIASLAHQIRTPLATALLYLSNLAHPHAHSGDRVHYAEKARDRLHHLERMVNDMLVFARGEVSDSECFDAAEFIDEFRQILEPQITESRATLSIDNQAPGASLCGNRDAMLSAFHNLANNALEACDDGLILEITMSFIDEGTVEFNFRDNGGGIPEDIRDRVLEPFFTTRTSGTGLGLAVVNATVSSFNGTLDIQSETDIGTVISITLPMMNSDMMLSSDITNSDAKVDDLISHTEYKNDKFSESHQEQEVSI
jgi:two-component system sensor histidine kinase FlrB